MRLQSAEAKSARSIIDLRWSISAEALFRGGRICRLTLLRSLEIVRQFTEIRFANFFVRKQVVSG